MTTSLKPKIEALLFVTGRPVSVSDIAETLGASHDAVEDALFDLIRDYAYREDSALEIDDTDGRYILQVREDYQDVVETMIPMEISAGAVRTLSAIAIKAPILQSELIELRGANAYEHIQELLAKKLISKKRQGRSYVLNVTQAFHNHFKLQGDKKELERLVMVDSLAQKANKGRRKKGVAAEGEAPTDDARGPAWTDEDWDAEDDNEVPPRPKRADADWDADDAEEDWDRETSE
jgi:segregation and condensation protein B